MLELWERSVRATHHFLAASDITELRPLVATALATEPPGWWVLRSDANLLIGFLGCGGRSIEALFLDPGHQRQGGGRLLVAHAQSLMPGELMVDVNEQNEAALGFYVALGFEITGRSPTDDGGRPFPILHLRRTGPGAS
jgi:putative acetyltransferase